MSVLKMGAACGALACLSALALSAPAAAQTKVYVKVVVEPQTQPYAAQSYAAQPYAAQHYAAPTHVQPAPQAYYAQPDYVRQQPAYSAPCPQALAHAPEYEAPRGVRYNTPIAHVQQSAAPQPYYERGTHYVTEPRMEPRAHSRWR